MRERSLTFRHPSSVEIRKLRFAIVANSVPESETMIGGYRIAIECAKRWLQAGHEIIFFTNPLGKAMISRYIQSADVRYVVAPIPFGLGGRAHRTFAAAVPFYLLMTASGMKRVWKESLGAHAVVYSVTPFWADVFPSLLLHSRTPSSRYLVAVSMFAPPLLAGWRVENAARGPAPEKRALALSLNQLVAYPFIRRLADGIYVNNELDRLRAINDGFPPSRVAVVGMGVDNVLASRVASPSQTSYDAMFIGRLHPQKGVLELVDIWQRLLARRPGARLAIIGNGPLEGQVRARIDDLGLTKQIDLLGFLDGIPKLEVCKASRVVVHPSLYDSGGMAALEAMSCGLPGVSFDLPDLSVYYPQGMLKAPCYDREAFALNIVRLLDDPVLYERLRQEALAWAHQWDWDFVAERLCRLAGELTGSHP